MGAYQPEDLDLYGDEGLGTLAREIVTEHPVLSAGAGLSTVVMAFVAANALWFQAAPHPSPMFETRTPIAARDVDAPARAMKIDVSTAPKKPVISQTERELMRAVQTALAARGYYKGKIDGVTGSRTRAAISAYERDNDLSRSGKPTVALLTAILQTPSQSVEVPVPTRNSPPEPDRLETAAISTAVSPRLVVDVQRGLKAYNNLEDLTVDGKMGRRTRHAIESFELQLGWKVTGRPSAKLVDKLRQLGALSAG